jgi:hypothetical protein
MEHMTRAFSSMMGGPGRPKEGSIVYRRIGKLSRGAFA